MPDSQEKPTLRARFQELNTATSRDAAALAARGKRATLWGLVVSPLFAFFRTYFRQGEWRNGVAGLVEATFTAYEVCVRYAKLWELHHAATTTPPPPHP